jgi:hypothetical protein
MMSMIHFHISVELDDTETLDDHGLIFNKMLSDMEEIVGKAGYSLDNADWYED